jgi:hypothetical protein
MILVLFTFQNVEKHSTLSVRFQVLKVYSKCELYTLDDVRGELNYLLKGINGLKS